MHCMISHLIDSVASKEVDFDILCLEILSPYLRQPDHRHDYLFYKALIVQQDYLAL